MPGVSVPIALARGLLLPAMRVSGGHDGAEDTFAMSSLPVPDLGDSGHDLSGHAHAATIVVSNHVVGDDSEEWGQCSGATACSGFEAVSNRLDVAA